MRSITVTTLRSINYGGVIQAFALHKYLLRHNQDNTLLDYCKLKTPYLRIPLKLSKASLIALVQNFFYCINIAKTRRLFDRFDSFINNHIRTTQSYSSFNQILKSPPAADLYITGSDQVFGIRGEYDNIRMLQFLPSGTRCVSYAASLGEYDWNEEEKREFNRRLGVFSNVSVREQYAADYIKDNAGIIPEVNIDPVFLLDKNDYISIGNPIEIPEQKYILCYSLISNSCFQKVMDEVKALTGYKTVCIHPLPMKRIKADYYVFDAGPSEFLSLIENAEFVLTTSFHGTALSIIYEKPFYTLIRNYKSQRITELLNKFGMSNRIYKGQDIDLNVDFSHSKSVIEQERKKTDNYFNSVLNSLQ